MLKRIIKPALIASMALFAGLNLSAQTGEYGSFSPYTIFGVGDLATPGSAYNRSMGGVGIASRNHRYLNTVNPAAITERDSLSFMLDFNVENNNKIFQQNYGGSSFKSASNVTNISSFAISFPIWRSLTAAAGLRPYSSTGYSFTAKETDPNEIATNGNITYSMTGTGSLYNVFLALGYTFFDRLSVGGELDYYFGSLEKTYDQDFTYSGFNEVSDTYTLTLRTLSGRWGAQYFQPLGDKWTLGFGATYVLGGKVCGLIDYSNIAKGTAESISKNSRTDTLKLKSTNVKFANELGLGVSINYADKFRAELDYTRANWNGSGMDLVDGFKVDDATMSFACSTKETYRFGMEWVPNINDVRYYRKKIAYRAGAYYGTEYYTVAGNTIKNVGFTLGATLPVFRWYNGLTIAMDLGQRGTLENSLIRERYIKFSIGVNLFDIWFQKPRYE